MAGALVLSAGVVWAQSPIPESRVPGFGGTNARPATNNPSASGSNVGSQMGAGANAGPSNEVIAPSNTPATEEALRPAPGSSGAIVITR
ncbi:MAG TPA: hypothetical protein VMI56_11925 [Reyranella sp.]|nr:hypothetical protein [Reyranella sp.]